MDILSQSTPPVPPHAALASLCPLTLADYAELRALQAASGPLTPDQWVRYAALMIAWEQAVSARPSTPVPLAARRRCRLCRRRRRWLSTLGRRVLGFAYAFVMMWR